MAFSTLNRILVPIKYLRAETPLSVLKAAQLARGLHAQLVLFHAIDTPLGADAQTGTGPAAGTSESGLRQQCLHHLATLAAPLRETTSVTVAAEWDYPAHEAVLRHAHHIGADLIVTERHAYGSGQPWALHSTDWELLRLSQKPVLLIKDADDRLYRQPVIVAALDPSHRHAKPAGLDEEICALAQAFSTALAGSWYALHAYAEAPYTALNPPPAAQAPAEDPRRDQAFAAVTSVLQSVALTPHAVLLRDVVPAQAIVEATREISASLLVIGALSRSGLKRLLIGNTAEEVIDQVSCDVLVVKPQGFGTHFSRHVQGPKYSPMPKRSPTD